MRFNEIGVGPGAVGSLGDFFGDFGSIIAKTFANKVYSSSDAVEDDMIAGFNKSLEDEQQQFLDDPDAYRQQKPRNIDKNTNELNKGHLLKSYLYNFMSAKHGDLPEVQQVLKKFDKNKAFVNGKPNRPYIDATVRQLAKIFVQKADIK